jgi:hypothetical protein
MRGRSANCDFSTSSIALIASSTRADLKVGPYVDLAGLTVGPYVDLADLTVGPASIWPT